MNERLLSRKEAAEFLGVTVGTLAVWTSTNRYPSLPLTKVGRLAKYKLSDLMNFIDNQEQYNSKR
ncbi:MAG: helix-turn-helix domain-containing protein [Sphingobacteriia bacterium]|nr:helix-turn-helix domain-containing protein [Sphingobacteriia bacterium]